MPRCLPGEAGAVVAPVVLLAERQQQGDAVIAALAAAMSRTARCPCIVRFRMGWVGYFPRTEAK
jgi:hypothetical protein